MILLAICLFFSAWSGDPQLSDVRITYSKAVNNEKTAEALYKELSALYNPSPTMLGYCGVSRMLLAKFAFNPYSKWNHFKVGKDLLESAIQKDGRNAELRMLRITTQLNVPEILDYSSDIESDRDFLVQIYPTIADMELKKMIREILISYKLASASDFKSR